MTDCIPCFLLYKEFESEPLFERDLLQNHSNSRLFGYSVLSKLVISSCRIQGEALGRDMYRSNISFLQSVVKIDCQRLSCGLQISNSRPFHRPTEIFEIAAPSKCVINRIGYNNGVGPIRQVFVPISQCSHIFAVSTEDDRGLLSFLIQIYTAALGTGGGQCRCGCPLAHQCKVYGTSS